MNWYKVATSENTNLNDVVIYGDPNDPSDNYFTMHFESNVRAVITSLFFDKGLKSSEANRIRVKKKMKSVVADFASMENELKGKEIKPWNWLISSKGKEAYRKLEKEVMKRYKKEAKMIERRAEGIDPLPIDNQQQQEGAPGGGLML